MIINNVDFPESLAASIAAGTCVVFAGAGVSKGGPANLPLFAELAQELAHAEPPKGEALDRFIGQLGPDRDVVAETVEIIRRSKTNNPVHEHLVELFRKPDQIKIVTTNYDGHFESAAIKRFGRSPEVFHAPALPLGSDFRGVVHVHGSIVHPPGIVLTDAHFGRAYLTEGWARRFLVDLFQHWDVLFVGYSHEDTIMDYLARALPPAQKQRYALVQASQSYEAWQRRRITPVPFGEGKSLADFNIQAAALHDFAHYLNRSATEWAVTLATIVKQAPPRDNALISQVVYALRKSVECRIFVEQTPSEEWLGWLDEQGLLRELVEDGKDEDYSRLLSRWIAHTLLPKNIDQVLDWLMRKGKVGRTLWHDLAFGVRNLPVDTDKKSVCTLLGFLVNDAPRNADSFHIRNLSEVAAKFTAYEAILAIFKLSSTSKPVFRERIRTTEGGKPSRISDVDAKLNYEHRHLREIIDDLRPSLDKLARRLFPLVCEMLVQRHGIRVRWGGLPDGFDSDSFGRAAIEPHDQDRFDDDCDPLIDLAREVIDWHANNDLATLLAWTAISQHHPTTLIRRLALYSLTVCPGQDPTAALKQLCTGALTDIWCKHEVYMVLRKFYGHAAEGSRKEILELLRADNKFEYSTPNEEAAFYYYQWAHDLSTHHPDCMLAAEACREIKSHFPTIISRDHPDLTHWTSSGWGSEPSPVNAKELLLLTPQEVIEDERKQLKAHRPGGGLREYYDEITNACLLNPGWSDELMLVLMSQESPSDNIREAILRSVAKRVEDPTETESVIRTLGDSRHYPKSFSLIAYTLRGLIDGDSLPHVIISLPSFDLIASKLWKVIKGTPGIDAPPSDWAHAALNSAAGTLADYVVDSISKQCRGAEGDDPKPIPEGLRSLILDMLTDISSHGGLCRASICSQVGNFLWLDKELATSSLLPLFESPDLSVRAQAWHGFLARARMYPALAQAMRAAIEHMITHDLSPVTEELHSFAQHLILAGLMISDSQALDWMLHPCVLSTENFRRAVSRQSLALCQGIPNDIMVKNWSGWLKQYWVARATRLQPALDGDEVEAYLDSLDDFETIFDDATGILDRFPHPHLKHAHILHAIHDAQLDEKHPDSASTILRFVLESPREQWCLFAADDVLKIIAPRMKDPQQRQSLVNLAIEKGAINSREGLKLLPDDPTAPPA